MLLTYALQIQSRSISSFSPLTHEHLWSFLLLDTFSFIIIQGTWKVRCSLYVVNTYRFYFNQITKVSVGLCVMAESKTFKVVRDMATNWCKVEYYMPAWIRTKTEIDLILSICKFDWKWGMLNRNRVSEWWNWSIIWSSMKIFQPGSQSPYCTLWSGKHAPSHRLSQV